MKAAPCTARIVDALPLHCDLLGCGVDFRSSDQQFPNRGQRLLWMDEATSVRNELLKCVMQMEVIDTDSITAVWASVRGWVGTGANNDRLEPKTLKWVSVTSLLGTQYRDSAVVVTAIRAIYFKVKGVGNRCIYPWCH